MHVAKCDVSTNNAYIPLANYYGQEGMTRATRPGQCNTQDK